MRLFKKVKPADWDFVLKNEELRKELSKVKEENETIEYFKEYFKRQVFDYAEKVSNLNDELKGLKEEHEKVCKKEFRQRDVNDNLRLENEELKKKIERFEAEKEIQLLKGEERPHVTNITLTYANPDDYRIVDCREDLYSIFDNVVTAKELKEEKEEPHAINLTLNYDELKGELKQKDDKPSKTALELAKAIKQEFDKGREKEHKCTKECFENHVLKAINRDKFNGHFEKNDLDFLRHWAVKLFNEYDFLAGVYYDKRGQVIVTFK